MCSLTLNKTLEEKLTNFIKSIISYRWFNNMIILQMFCKLPSLDQFTKMYLERWFTVFVETKCFLKLDYAFVHRLLSSSNLRITSEVQVFDAVDAWVRYDIETRKKYAKTLLLQVRFPLLSDSAVSHILNKNSSFKQIEECCAIVNEILKKKIKFLHKSENYFTNRYCSKSISTSKLLLNDNSVFIRVKLTFFTISMI